MIDIRLGDCLDVLRTLPDGMARTCVTSPPYFGLRDYGVDGQIGLEDTPDAYVARLVEVFREVRRVLADDGTLWLNLGDSYASTSAGSYGSSDKSTLTTSSRNGYWAPGNTIGTTPRRDTGGLGPKQLLGIPWRVAFSLQADGWTLRSDIVWAKPNPMPESVRDRPTKAHEYVFLLSKRPRYFYDAEAVKEPINPAHKAHYERYKNRPVVGRGANPSRKDGGGLMQGSIGYPPGGRNARTVWTITPRPFKGAHFATFPPELAERCVKAGSSERGRCPECGAAWVRVMERERVATRPGLDTKTTGLDTLTIGNRDPQRHVTTTRPVGWRPTCDHGRDPVPDVVLDPFAGAGTVGLVCQRLGRSHVGIELNPAYREMALARIAADAPRMPLLAGA